MPVLGAPLGVRVEVEADARESRPKPPRPGRHVGGNGKCPILWQSKMSHIEDCKSERAAPNCWRKPTGMERRTDARMTRRISRCAPSRTRSLSSSRNAGLQNETALSFLTVAHLLSSLKLGLTIPISVGMRRFLQTPRTLDLSVALPGSGRYSPRLGERLPRPTYRPGAHMPFVGCGYLVGTAVKAAHIRLLTGCGR